MERNFYATLGLSRTAAETDITASLDRELSKASNLSRIPTRQAETEARRQALQLISQTLLNPATRSMYDAYLSAVDRENRPRIGFSAPERTSAAVVPASEKSVPVFCSACGRPSRNLAKFCAGCGSGLEPAPTDAMGAPVMPRNASCPGCGRAVSQGQSHCSECGVYTHAAQAGAKVAAMLDNLPWNPPQAQPSAGAVAPAWPDLSPYYQKEFRLIYESGESYKGKWNWAAFIFGFIWALTKGLWLPFLVALIVSIMTSGIGGVVYWFIFGARGNYMYYCAKAKNKQLPF